MSEKKDRELSEKELEKAAGGGQPYSQPGSKDVKSPLSSTGDDQGLSAQKPQKPPFGDSDSSKSKK